MEDITLYRNVLNRIPATEHHVPVGSMPDAKLAVVAETGDRWIDWRAEYLRVYHRMIELQRQIEALTPDAEHADPYSAELRKLQEMTGGHVNLQIEYSSRGEPAIYRLWDAHKYHFTGERLSFDEARRELLKEYVKVNYPSGTPDVPAIAEALKAIDAIPPEVASSASAADNEREPA